MAYFVNNLTDLHVYATEHGLDGFVVAGRAYLRKGSERYQAYRRDRRSGASGETAIQLDT